MKERWKDKELLRRDQMRWDEMRWDAERKKEMIRGGEGGK